MSASSAAVASRFGQRLAHTEKKYRDQALKKLTAYLARKREWAPLEWDKLWKALFYCMWMSDKRPVQMELARSLARLVHAIPARREALGFLRSFLRTMHREWHGLDGLRLDKFYDLVRQFVRESVALLAAHGFPRAAVGEFVDMLSAEVVSQRPNGLRMHLADLYLAEICGAAGDKVETGAFLLLLEPFFTLLGSEYDQSVFKRVRDLVFQPMLGEFLFGEAAKEAAEKKKKKSDDETDDDDDDEPVRGFPRVDLARVQHRIFAIAAAEDTAERNRAALYELYGKFAALTEVDSLKVAQEEALNPPEEEEDAEMDEAEEDKPVAEEQQQKKKKSKKRKQADVLAQELQEETKAEEVVPPAKKSKKAKTPAEEPKEAKEAPQKEEAQKSKKSKKQAEESSKNDKAPVEDKPKKKKAKKSIEDEPIEKKPEEPKPVEKKSKKEKKEAKQEDKPVEKKSKKEKKDAKQEDKPVEKAAKQEEKLKEEKKKKPAVVVKSGVKFQRCASCGGFGKNLVRAGKDMCGHCERTKKTQKKASAKKRKAEDQRAAEEAEAAAASSKKVTFGKNKALPHSLSVKRLKASAKKDAVLKDADIKGVLKASTSPPPAAKKSKKAQRKAAADFF